MKVVIIVKRWYYCFFVVIMCLFITGCNKNTQEEKTFLVIFETNGGITIPSQRVALGENAIEPETPTRTNYKFIGWYLYGDIFDFSMPINRDITLEARWKYSPASPEYETMLTITFAANNYDEPYFTETVNSGSLIGVPPPPIRNGYIFNEWTYNNSSFDFNNSVAEDNIDFIASWDKIDGNSKFLVSFDSNGGTSVDNQMIVQGNRVLYPVAPTKKGYTFVGWSLDGVTYNFDAPVSRDITLVANWVKNGSSGGSSSGGSSGQSTTIIVNQYMVVFETYGGTKINNQYIIAGKKVTKPKDPVKDGYTFRGWNYNGNIYNFNSLVNSSMVLYAIWERSSSASSKTFTVKFDTKGGSAVASQKVRENNAIKVPVNPTKSGYTFAGWKYDGKNFDLNTKITRSITLEASWTTNPVNPKEYVTISFDSNGGSDVDNYIVEKGSNAVRPTDPNREGYIFNYWTLDGKEYKFNTPVLTNTKLVANWVKVESKKYTVYFNTLGGSNVASQTVESGGKVSKPNDPTRSGSKFDCWVLNGVEYDFESLVTSNISLDARWIKVDDNYYNVIFESNGGTGVGIQSVKSGSTANKPVPNPTQLGHTFVEWQLDGQRYNFDSPVTKEIVLVAKWKANKTYVVAFNYDGDKQIMYKVVEEGKTVSQPDTPISYGYTFVEWQLNGKKYNFNTPVTSDIMLNAIWKSNSTNPGQNETKYYNVSFNGNGGTSPETQKIAEGGTATRPANPTWPGHTFKGWYFKGNTFDFNTKIYSNVELYAVWE